MGVVSRIFGAGRYYGAGVADFDGLTRVCGRGFAWEPDFGVVVEAFGVVHPWLAGHGSTVSRSMRLRWRIFALFTW